MEYAFIEQIESWGSGGHMLDVITLKDGRILVVTEEAIVLYPDPAAFEAGTQGRTLD